MATNSKKALILVDLQNDFCEGGSLAAPRASEIIPVANRLQPAFDLVIATQDWHPAGHHSFASTHPGHQPGDVISHDGRPQTLWPDHCVQNTPGAALHPQLRTEHIHQIVYKGTNPAIDSYSAFYDNAHLQSTGLSDYLRQNQIEKVYIMGIATDFCVKFSALDAVQEGFDVTLILDGVRAVNLHPDDAIKALNEMKNAGVKFVNSDELL